MWGVCTPQYKNVYRVNHTTGSLVQDIFTNTIEHFELKFVQPDLWKKTIYIPHMGVQNNYYHSLLFTAYGSSLYTCFLQVLHTDFTFQSFDLGQNSHLFAIVCESCELI